MLDHFFGFFDFSSPVANLNRLKDALLDELAQFDGRFQVISRNHDRAYLASNAFIFDFNESKVGIALCGALVSKPSELTLAEIAVGAAAYPSDAQVKELLNDANGTFAVAMLDLELWLATDFLGGRPIYYAIWEGVLIFGTAFDLVKRLVPQVCELDLQAVSEDFCFGYPLGNRTLVKEVKVLRSGEYVHCRLGKVEVDYYSKFPVDGEKCASLEASLDKSERALKAAIRERVQSENEVQLALLSGGLDSRVIVSELLDAGFRVTAVNYSMPGTFDRVFAERFSKITSTDMIVNEYRRQYQNLSLGEVTSFLLNSAQRSLPMQKIFSGDGGGEIFGFIDLKPGHFAGPHTSSIDAFVDQMLHQQPSRHIAGREFSRQIADRCREGLRAQLGEIGLEYGLRAVYVLYLTNDLRCHLHEYFSGLYSETRELLLPFYDRRVIMSALSISEIGDGTIGHSYYYRLLERLSPKIKITPWQAYPGSLPCPVQDSDKAGVSQWTYESNANLSDAAKWADIAMQSIRHSTWIAGICRVKLLVLCWLARFGLYKDSYIFKQALRVSRYFSSV